MTLKKIALALIFMLVFVGCSREEEATQVPTDEPATPVMEETAAPEVVEEIMVEAAEAPAEEPTEPAAEETMAPVEVEEVAMGVQANPEVVSRIGIHPNQLALNT